MTQPMRLVSAVLLFSLGATASAAGGKAPPPPPAKVAPAAPAAPKPKPAPVAETPKSAPATVAAAEPTAPTATTTAPAPASSEPLGVLVGLKVGGLFAQPFTSGKLGTSYVVDLEVGYLLPVLERRLGVVLEVGYSEPGAKGTQTDPRIDANGGSYAWSLTQRELMLGLTATFRFPMGALTPYAGIGPRVWFLQTLVQGTAGDGNVISQTREQSTKVGLVVPIGIGYLLGPGSVFFEAQLLWAQLDHRITGDSSVGSITTSVGYRMVF